MDVSQLTVYLVVHKTDSVDKRGAKNPYERLFAIAGGSIVSTRCTEVYNIQTAQVSIFGIPLWYATNSPRVAIQVIIASFIKLYIFSIYCAISDNHVDLPKIYYWCDMTIK